MPTDAERFHFIEKFRLHVTFHSDHVTLMWRRNVLHWEASPPYFPVASGKTLAEATDAAIERYNRKHGITEPDIAEQQEPSTPGIVWLAVKGWMG